MRDRSPTDAVAAGTAPPSAAAPGGVGRVGVLGAGAVGCLLGGLLADEAESLVLVGRARVAAEVAEHGLTLRDLAGRERRWPPGHLRYETTPEALANCDVVLVAVKATETATAAATLAAHAPRDATVVSLQNGVRNVALLQAALGSRPVLGAMVSFNVLARGAGRFEMATSGPIALARELEPAPGRGAALAAAWRRAGLAVVARDDVAAIQWGKLLFNLNNGLAALSDLPLRDELSDRRFRRLLAAAMGEGLAALRAAGLRPARLGRMIPGLAARLLPLPDALFARVAGAMVRIDPAARSSMWDDLVRGRATEVDLLNGEIVALGARHGVATPVNSAIVRLIHAAEAAGAGPPGLAPEAIWEAARAG